MPAPDSLTVWAGSIAKRASSRGRNSDVADSLVNTAANVVPLSVNVVSVPFNCAINVYGPAPVGPLRYSRRCGEPTGAAGKFVSRTRSPFWMATVVVASDANPSLP